MIFRAWRNFPVFYIGIPTNCIVVAAVSAAVFKYINLQFSSAHVQHHKKNLRCKLFLKYTYKCYMTKQGSWRTIVRILRVTQEY